MTIILVFLGWFILNSLWGFLPLIEPLRQFALSGPRRRITTTFASGLLAFLMGTVLLLWVATYSVVVIMNYDAHASTGSAAAQAAANITPVTNELTLRQLLPGASCLSRDVAVCAQVDQALQLGSLTSMLPIISATALLPALLAAFICWKLTRDSPPSVAS